MAIARCVGCDDYDDYDNVESFGGMFLSLLFQSLLVVVAVVACIFVATHQRGEGKGERQRERKTTKKDTALRGCVCVPATNKQTKQTTKEMGFRDGARSNGFSRGWRAHRETKGETSEKWVMCLATRKRKNDRKLRFSSFWKNYRPAGCGAPSSFTDMSVMVVDSVPLTSPHFTSLNCTVTQQKKDNTYK